MATVTVPPEFFRAELRVYGDWRTGFARELLQNATDARPSRIDVSFETVDGHGRVTFTDDGHGMTRDVLENVFFALGRTTKTGPDSIGGFGRARIILCFAQVRYAIHTGNLLAEGVGGEYTIREVAEHMRGTRFTIDTIDDQCSSLRYQFERLLSQSSLSVPVYVDGIRQFVPSAPTRATRVLRDAQGQPWARIYASPGAGSLLVRVHGLVMFNQWLSTDDNVIVELIPSRSREVLSASRDMLVGEYGEQLGKFVSQLANNRRAALAPSLAPLETRVGGGGFLVSDATVQPASPLRSDEPSGRSGDVTRVVPANEAAFTNLAAAAPLPTANTLFDDWGPAQVEPLGFDVFLLAQANDTRVRKLARAWDPSMWTTKAPRNKRALLLAWKAAVSCALEVLMAQNGESLPRVMWTVGWTFDPDVGALHKLVSDDGHVLALNPVTADGKIAFHLSRRSDRQRLLATAVHEVAHVLWSDHNESFAGVLTDLFGALDVADADRQIRAAARM